MCLQPDCLGVKPANILVTFVHFFVFVSFFLFPLFFGQNEAMANALTHLYHKLSDVSSSSVIYHPVWCVCTLYVICTKQTKYTG